MEDDQIDCQRWQIILLLLQDCHPWNAFTASLTIKVRNYSSQPAGSHWQIGDQFIWLCFENVLRGRAYVLRFSCRCSRTHLLWELWGPDGYPPVIRPALKGFTPSETAGHRGPSGDRGGIGRCFQPQWRRGDIYLMVPQPKPQATNKEDAVMPFDWAASVWLEMKCPVVSYRGWTSFVQPESGNIFPPCLSGCSSPPWMMPAKPQPLRYEDFKKACNGLACLQEII